MPYYGRFVSGSTVISFVILLVASVPFASAVTVSPVKFSRIVSVLLLLVIVSSLIFELSIPITVILT